MGKQRATRSTEYAAMVAEAEASVSAVKDPELRRVAFERVLAALLERGQSGSRVQKPSPRPERRSPRGEKTDKPSAGATRRGPKGLVEALVGDSFFKKQRTIAAVKAELANQGHHIALTSLSGPLQRLTQERRLRRQRVTAGAKGSKGTFAYSNW